MKGIAPLWSPKALVAYIVSPPAAGVIFALLLTLIAAFDVDYHGRHPTVLKVIGVIPFAVVGGAFFGAIKGYPFAILVAAPVHALIFSRLRRVRYWHFFLLGLLMSFIWLYSMVDLRDLAQAIWNMESLGRFDLQTPVIMHGGSTLLAVTIFYWIVRTRPADEKASKAMETG